MEPPVTAALADHLRSHRLVLTKNYPLPSIKGLKHDGLELGSDSRPTHRRLVTLAPIPAGSLILANAAIALSVQPNTFSLEAASAAEGSTAAPPPCDNCLLPGVAGKLRCTSCRVARYCSPQCQREAWTARAHSTLCRFWKMLRDEGQLNEEGMAVWKKEAEMTLQMEWAVAGKGSCGLDEAVVRGGREEDAAAAAAELLSASSSAVVEVTRPFFYPHNVGSAAYEASGWIGHLLPAEFNEPIKANARVFADVALRDKDARKVVRARDAGDLLKLFTLHMYRVQGNGFEVAMPPAESVDADATSPVERAKALLESPSPLFHESTDTVMGYFPFGALVNHGCDANATSEFRGRVQYLVAQRDIDAGEEITIVYVDRCMQQDLRRQYLRSIYTFDCNCAQCRGVDVGRVDAFLHGSGKVAAKLAAMAGEVERRVVGMGGEAWWREDVVKAWGALCKELFRCLVEPAIRVCETGVMLDDLSALLDLCRVDELPAFGKVETGGGATVMEMYRSCNKIVHRLHIDPATTGALPPSEDTDEPRHLLIKALYLVPAQVVSWAVRTLVYGRLHTIALEAASVLGEVMVRSGWGPASVRKAFSSKPTSKLNKFAAACEMANELGAALPRTFSTPLHVLNMAMKGVEASPAKAIFVTASTGGRAVAKVKKALEVLARAG
ncbi:SET and MYND domain-containing protein 3 [Phlyctochytrium bullatum]|nr:SET and MYND domain-containing protein 3 [Phlyctochytrium bullatum]